MCIRYQGTCPICKRQGTKKDEHHKRKWKVFHEHDTVFLCQNLCHIALEAIIRQKENAILIQHPEIYDDTLQEFIDGKYDPFLITKKINKERNADKQHKRRKR
jgi:hypothetical protein